MDRNKKRARAPPINPFRSNQHPVRDAFYEAAAMAPERLDDIGLNTGQQIEPHRKVNNKKLSSPTFLTDDFENRTRILQQGKAE